MYGKSIRRNKNKLENRRGERQHELRKYWTTHQNFDTMYGHLYVAMVDAKVATPMYKYECYFMNRARSRFKRDKEAAGHHIKQCRSHPQYVLFRDEVGTDTYQMDGGNNVNHRYIRIK